MARLHIMNFESERRVEVTLSRRNLLALLHKLDMPGSTRQLENTDCYEDGIQISPSLGQDPTPFPPTTLVLGCEDDDEHYARRALGPGVVHPDTEQFVQNRGGAPGEVLVIEYKPSDG